MTGLNKSTAPNTETGLSLVRTIAVASRKLDEDMNLSPLQAIDRLQKLHGKFQKHWYGSPWLVLVDGHPLPASVPVGKMLEEIEKHGEPIGIVGVARITKRQDSVLVMNFREDERSQKTVEKSAQDAKALVDKANEQADKIAKEIAEQKIHELHRGQK
jgi:hypothetical protein